MYSALLNFSGIKRKRNTEEEDRERKTAIKFLKEKGYGENLVKKLTSNNKKIRRYSNDDICEAILLHAVSAKAYEMLRRNSILPLPHKETLSRKVKHFRCAPGLQLEFFNFIKLKMSVADMWERQCVLMFDEMHISQSYEYCGRLKQMFGAHKKVQVVLIR